MDSKKPKEKAKPKRKAATKKNKGGRPTKYKSEYNEQVKKLCLLGAIDKDIANFFNVSEATLNNWKRSEPEFLESIKEGREIADNAVASRLFDKAMGYSLSEVKEEESDTGGKKTVRIKKEIAADTTAQIFWLKNRQPHLWREKTQSENINHNLEYSQLSDEELDSKLAELESIHADTRTEDPTH